MITIQLLLAIIALCSNLIAICALIPQSTVQVKKSPTEFSSINLPNDAKEIKEPAAQYLMSSMRKASVVCPQEICQEPVLSSFALLRKQQTEQSVSSSPFDFFGPKKRSQGKSKAPILLVHGFDSSSLEFRRLAPLLCSERDVYAVDILGWG
jgi:hypothetical protein